MPKAESFVQTPDGPGNVKSVDLLRELVKVSLDSGPETLKTYHNCEIKVLRNGKGSREGIEIPERPARYVEEHEEEELAPPVFAAPFYMNSDLEEAPRREKIGMDSGGDGKNRRRHRGGRRRGPGTPRPEGAPNGGQAAPPRSGGSGKKEPPRQQPPRPKDGERPAAENRQRRRPYRGGRRWNKGGDQPKG